MGYKMRTIGKESGNCCIIVGYILGIMEKTMETTIYSCQAELTTAHTFPHGKNAHHHGLILFIYVLVLNK